MVRKSPREKMLRLKEPKLVDDPKGRGRMLVPTPLLIDGLIRKIPRGKLATVGQLREKLARDHGADLTCPLTTGIFLRIIAEVAEEDLKEGRKATPYWRVIRQDGSLNEKFPRGGKLQAKRLKEENHSIIEEKGKLKVKEYVKALYKF